jgi:cellulose synthase/poly-beta-1,6-N-acetylglucosamine synthase-like glycosyltransferase
VNFDLKEIGFVVINTIVVVVQLTVFFFSIYSFLIALCGLKRRKEKKHYIPEKTFAVIVPAHNESRVIAKLIDSLHEQNYPRELFDIFVIADNCTDDTAELARQHGAEVYERFDEEKRSKPYALEWFFERLWLRERQYDAIVMFDADNLVSQNFLLEMNSELCLGQQVIQGYLDTKNPDDSLITQYYAIAYWYMNRTWQLARRNLGLANALGGTGVCIEVGILRKLGWGVTSLTEDLEFTMKAVLNGVKPTFAWDARIYDEKPSGFQASWRQRLRWMRGHWDVAFNYVPALLKRAITKRDVVALDSALYLLQPSRLLLQYVVLIMLIVSFIEPYTISWAQNITPLHFLPAEVWLVAFFTQWVFPPLIIAVLLIDRVGYKRMLGVFWFQFMEMIWLPLTIYGLITSRDKRWAHTKHTKAVSLTDIGLTPEASPAAAVAPEGGKAKQA